MEVMREDFHASSEDVYRSRLEARVLLLKAKKWSDMSVEEKETLAEWMAYRAGLVAAG